MATGRSTRPDSIKAFLAKKAKSEALLYGAGSALLGMAGAGLVAFVWMLLQAIARFSLDNGILAGLIAAAFVGVMFLLNWKISADLTPQLRFFEEDDGTLVVLLATPEIEPWKLVLNDPEGGMFLVRLVTSIFFVGPKMINLATKLGFKAWALHQLDVGGCSKVIVTLMKSDSRVAFTEIVAKHQHKRDLRQILPQLQNVTGVAFLTSEPMGLTLTPLLREEIVDWKEQQGAADSEFQFED